MLNESPGPAGPPTWVSCPGCAEAVPPDVQFCRHCGKVAPTPLLPGPPRLKNTLAPGPESDPPVPAISEAAPTYAFEHPPAAAEAPSWLCYEQLAVGTRSSVLQVELRDDGHPRFEGDTTAFSTYDATASVRASRPAGSGPAVTQTLFSRAPTRAVLGIDRLVVVVFGATTVLGPSEPQSGTLFCLSLPLETIGAVTLERSRGRRGSRGRHRDTAVLLSGRRTEPYSVRLESIVQTAIAPGGDERATERTPLAPRTIFDELVHAVIAHRRTLGNGSDPGLVAVEQGPVAEIGDDLVAVLADDRRDAL